MTADEAISLAEDQIRVSLRQERVRLVADIKAMRHQHAAKGLLRSGVTLQRVRDLEIESLRRRAQFVLSALTLSLESAKPSVINAQALLQVVISFLPENLDDQGEHIRTAVAEVNVPNVLERLLAELSAARADELQKIQVELQLFVSKHAVADAPALHGRIFGATEVVLLIATFALIALWIANPFGPFEPYLALLMAVGAAVGMLRNLRRKAIRNPR